LLRRDITIGLKHSYNKESRNIRGNYNTNPSLKVGGREKREKKEKILPLI
jgi:hypothetical protein